MYVVQYLVELGADNVEHALRVASSKGDIRVVEYFISKGVDINTWENGAIKHASLSGNSAIAH